MDSEKQREKGKGVKSSTEHDSESVVVYLCGAGGKGNLGAEAIMLAIIKIFQRRFENVSFVIATWYVDRIRKILKDIPGEFPNIHKESVLSSIRGAGRIDYWIICGDVAITETVVPVLPLYYGLKAAMLRPISRTGLFFGIEAEQIRKPYNLFALKHLIDKPSIQHILRNRKSVANLNTIPMRRSPIHLGCDPTLMLQTDDFASFDVNDDRLSNSKPLVGFAIRDFFTQPLRVNWKGQLIRTDTQTGQLSSTVDQLITTTAQIADYIAETQDAQIVFMPHHYLPEGDRVIMPDCEIAQQIIDRMRNPDAGIILENDLHPFALIHFYQRLTLSISMRHHANCFALLHGVPTICYSISDKLKTFFRENDLEDMMIDPFKDNLENIKRVISRAFQNRENLSLRLATILEKQRKTMKQALRISLTQDGADD